MKECHTYLPHRDPTAFAECSLGIQEDLERRLARRYAKWKAAQTAIEK